MTNTISEEERMYKLFKHGLREAKAGKSVTEIMKYVKPELEKYTLSKQIEARIDELNSLPHQSVTALTSSVDQSIIYERIAELRKQQESKQNV